MGLQLWDSRGADWNSSCMMKGFSTMASTWDALEMLGMHRGVIGMPLMGSVDTELVFKRRASQRERRESAPIKEIFLQARAGARHLAW